MSQGAMDGGVTLARMYGMSQRARDGGVTLTQTPEVTLHGDETLAPLLTNQKQTTILSLAQAQLMGLSEKI